jgi:N6-adenosine-specific RNA methylase IME4
MAGGAADNYSTIPIKDLEGLDLKSIMETSGSLLFFWCPSPLATIGYRYVDNWGFKHRFTMYWVKEDSDGSQGQCGMGYWLANQVEICIVGSLGNVKPWRDRTTNFFFEKPTGKHSEKPKKFWEIVGKHTIDGPRVELFSREKRKGWKVWGNQVTSDVDCSSILRNIKIR